MVRKLQNMNIGVADYMHGNYIALKGSITIEEAISILRQNVPSDQISYLYILDEEEKLIGVTPIRELLFNKPETALKNIMLKKVVKLNVTDKLNHAANIFAQKKFLALPVVDEQNHILGIIDINVFTDDALKLIKEQETEKIFQLIGIHILSDKRASSWKCFKDRFPWLLSNMASGIICAIIASMHGFLLAEVAIIAMFMTVVLALAESVSMQVTTVSTLLLPEKRIRMIQFTRLISRELSISFLIGLACALIIGFVSFIWKGSLLQSTAIAASVMLSIILACLWGVLIPSIIRALKFDPKVAAGPIVLAMADIFTLIVYFNLMGFLV
jgi:magnesium transporter